MWLRRALLCGLAVGAWSGCIAITNLDQYTFDDGIDAATDGSDAGRSDLPDAVTDALITNDAAVDGGPADAGPVDAGPCGKCPRSTARMLCVTNACTETRRVFVTKASFAANFGSVAAADTKCQSAADAAKLGGQWKAWLSDPTSRPRDRFDAGTAPYRLLDGTVFIASGALLVGNDAPAIQHPIDIDETDTKVVSLEVWTGTGGSIAKGTCKSWTSNAVADEGVVGVTNMDGGGWTNIYRQFCDRVDPHLYCFEQ